jgi:hypothetical protein
MPDLAVIQNQYAALGEQVISAVTDAAEDKQKVMQFIKIHWTELPPHFLPFGRQ